MVRLVADAPSPILQSVLRSAIEATGAFRAVVSIPGSASGDLRLETEVLLLQHEFGSQPSHVRFALRAYLAEDGTRRVVATRDFEAVQPAPSEDPYGGVQAANAAVRSVLEALAAFCAETAAAWQPARTVSMPVESGSDRSSSTTSTLLANSSRRASARLLTQVMA